MLLVAWIPQKIRFLTTSLLNLFLLFFLCTCSSLSAKYVSYTFFLVSQFACLINSVWKWVGIHTWMSITSTPAIHITQLEALWNMLKVLHMNMWISFSLALHMLRYICWINEYNFQNMEVCLDSFVLINQ